MYAGVDPPLAAPASSSHADAHAWRTGPVAFGVYPSRQAVLGLYLLGGQSWGIALEQALEGMVKRRAPRGKVTSCSPFLATSFVACFGLVFNPPPPPHR